MSVESGRLPTHSAVKAAVTRFVAEHVLGKERELDSADAKTAREAHEAFQRAGLSSWWLGPEHGGLGLSMQDSVELVEELAYGDAGLTFSLFISILCTKVLELFGTPEQKLRCLDGFAARGDTAGMMGSEREAGSELLRIATRCVPEGDGWRLTGDKYFCTNGGSARFLIALCATPDDPPAFQALLLAQGTPGLSVKRRWKVSGVRASEQYEMRMDGVRVSADALIPVNGLRLLEVGLNFSRVLIATTAIGVARRIRDLALEYAQTKELKGTLLRHSPVFMAKLGQIEAEIECMRSVCMSAARDLDERWKAPDAAGVFARSGVVKSALVAKLLCGQIGWKIAGIGSEMFGGLGYTEDSIVEKLLRDVRFVGIVEGGEDVIRELIYTRFVRSIAPRPT